MPEAIRCPYNLTGACNPRPKPISYSESEEEYTCDNAPCGYIDQLNHNIRSRSNQNEIIDQLVSIKHNIGAEGENEDDTIAQALECIREQLDWIRRNIGATGDEDGTIAGRLDDVIDNSPGDSTDVLNNILYQLQEINDNTCGLRR